MNPVPDSPPRLNDVLARTVLVFLMTLAAWFGGLMTGVIRLDWLVHWLGTPKLEPPWDKIAFFGPAVISAVAYFIYALSRLRTQNPEPRTLNEPGTVNPEPRIRR